MRFSKSSAAKPDLTPTSTSRSGLSTTPSRLPDPFGLHTVTDPKDPTADIIFIHGLGGSAFRTWSWKRLPENFWPAWLSEDEHLGRCRIHTFGYNSNFKGEARGLNVVDFAKDLLLQMLNHPGGIGRDRPILFVAHSMGGLVVKKAYTLGRIDRRFTRMVSSVTGIVFLATPHRGSQYAKILSRVLAAGSMLAPPKEYVSALEQDSPTIQDISGVFSHHCEELVLVSFYETLPVRLSITKLIVRTCPDIHPLTLLLIKPFSVDCRKRISRPGLRE